MVQKEKRRRKGRKMQGKDIGRGLVMGIIGHWFVSLIGGMFGVPIFPDLSLGFVYALGKVLLAGAFIIIVAVITAFIGPQYLKTVIIVISIFGLGVAMVPVSALPSSMVMEVPEFPVATTVLAFVLAASLVILRHRRHRAFLR